MSDYEDAYLRGWHEGQRFMADEAHTPTPEPSEVAETTAGEREVEALVAAATDALMASRLTWGTHADRWGDVEWQREFWAEVASIVLTPALLDRVRREEGAKVLREAADDMDRLNHGGHRPPEPYLPAGTSGAIDWLRARAASVGRGEDR